MVAGKKNSDNLGEFYVGRRRPLPAPRRILPKGVLTVLFLFGFAAIIWYAYPEPSERFDGIDIPTIRAEVSPYKFKPDDPGGMNVPYQDSTIFDPLENKTARADKIETLMPEPEIPIQKTEIPPIPLEQPKLNLEKKMDATAEPKVKAGEGAPKMEPISPGTEKVVLTKPQPEKPVEGVAKIAAEAKTSTGAMMKPRSKPKQDKTLTQMQAQAPVERVLLNTTTQSSSPVDGTVYVRLGSYTSSEKADQDWQRFSKKYTHLLTGLKKRVVPADLGAKGMYYRLEAGNLPESEAKKVCTEISKTKVGGCLVIK